MKNQPSSAASQTNRLGSGSRRPNGWVQRDHHEWAAGASSTARIETTGHVVRCRLIGSGFCEKDYRTDGGVPWVNATQSIDGAKKGKPIPSRTVRRNALASPGKLSSVAFVAVPLSLADMARPTT